MLIEKGKFFKNKTWEYLIPCFKLYEPMFIEYFNKLVKYGVGIHDTLLDDEDYPIGKYVYILFDTSCYRENFEKLLEYLSNKASHLYVTDYSFGPSLELNQHMVVLRIPNLAQEKYNHFLNGEYSKMYSFTDMAILNLKVTRPLAYSVITKQPEGYEHYKKRIKSVFDVNLTQEEITGELDTPPGTFDEIFNQEKVFAPFYAQSLIKEYII